MRRIPLILSIFALFAAACSAGRTAPSPVRAEGQGSAAGAASVSFRRDVEPILMGGCAGEYCHGKHVDTPKRAYGFLVNQPSDECSDGRKLVVPGEPDRSYVLDKIEGKNLCGGSTMPRGLWNRLPPDQIAVIERWIAEGARYD